MDTFTYLLEIFLCILLLIDNRDPSPEPVDFLFLTLLLKSTFEKVETR